MKKDFLSGYTFENRISSKGVRGTSYILIEVAFVFLIIGLLVNFSLNYLNKAESQTRDVKRISDLRAISYALELYSIDHGHYPRILPESESKEKLLREALVPKYLSRLPQDPLFPKKRYYYQSVGSLAEDFLLIADLENEKNENLSDCHNPDLKDYPTFYEVCSRRFSENTLNSKLISQLVKPQEKPFLPLGSVGEVNFKD